MTSYGLVPAPLRSTNEDLTGLEAGEYTVSITDDLGCTAEASITITENTTITIDIDENQPTCNEANGSLEANVSGGTISTDYFYFWYDISNWRGVGRNG